MLISLLSSLSSSISLSLLPPLLSTIFISNLIWQWLRFRNIPGPFWAKFTDLWRLFAVRRGNAHEEYHELHKQYGDFLRIGPSCISLRKPNIIQDIYGINTGFNKSDYYAVWTNIVNGKRAISLVFSQDESAHAKLKRPIASAFALSTLVKFEPLLDSTTAVFIAQLDDLFERTGKVCDLGTWIQWYAFDVMGELTFNKRLGFLERAQDVEGIISSIGANLHRCAVLGQMPWLDLVTYKNPIYLKFFAKPVTNPVIAFGKRRLDERTEGPEEKSAPDIEIEDSELKTKLQDAGEAKEEGADFLSRYLKVHQEQPELVSDTMLLALLFSNINAGSDTVASTMRAIFYYLLKNPESMQKLLEELDGTFSAGKLTTPVPTWSEVQSLPYLNAVINEALRINPALALPMERIVPSSGLQIEETFFPPGTNVGINPWVLHRDPRIFGEDAESWNPNRWLDKDELKLKYMESNLLSFSAGSRTCLGKHIAMLEMSKIVPALLLRYAIKLERPDSEWTLWNAWAVRQDGLKVFLKSRKQ